MAAIKQPKGRLVLGGIAALALVGGAQGAQGVQETGPAWSYVSDGSWIADAISLGNQGTQVFTEFGAFSNSAMMLSSHDAHPPAPVWVEQGMQTNMFRVVASSRDSDVHVAMHQRTLPGSTNVRRAVLRKYSSSSGTHDWVREVPVNISGHPYSRVAVSDDGQRIVAVVYDSSQGKTRVELLAPHSNAVVAVHELGTGIPFKEMALSPDGRKLILSSQLWVRVVDVDSGVTELSKNLFGAPDYGAIALSGDGQLAAFGTMTEIWVFERGSNGSYQQTDTLALPSGSACQRLGISRDGATLAAGLYWPAQSQSIQVRAYDLATRSLTMQRTLQGTGSLPNQVSRISLSNDGRRFAVGLWGDEGGLVPEVLVFDRDEDEPVFTYHLPGSVNVLDLSPAGDYLAVASKGVHANVAGGGGAFWLFRTENKDLGVQGVPSLGDQVEVEHSLDPGAVSRILVSPLLADQPESFGPTGTLHLQRSTTSYLPGSRTAGSDGVARHAMSIPSDPGLIGTSLYIQGIEAGPRRLSDTWVKLTVLP